MPASLVDTITGVEIWSGPLEHGEKVLLFLNGNNPAPTAVSFDMAALGYPSNVSEVTCRDVWLHQPCTSGGSISTSNTIVVTVAVHGVVMMRLTPKTEHAQRMTVRHHITADEAVAAAQHAAADAATYHTALHHHEAQPPPPPPQLKESKNEHDYHLDARYGLIEALEFPADAPMGWPMRGYDATHSGRSPFKGPAGCPTIKWSQSFGEGNRSYVWTESSPAVDASGRVFVGSGAQMWALNISNGDVLWNVSAADPEAEDASEFFSSPALAGGLVLAGAGSGTMKALHAETGALAWSFAVGDAVKGMNGGTGKAPITGSVVLSTSGKLAFVGAWDGCLYAFDPATGKISWKFQAIDADTNTNAQIRATPALSKDSVRKKRPFCDAIC
jgi:hypothetical protein